MLQKLMKLMRKDQKGFTLVELMIVVVIIGILIAIAIPVYNTIQANAEKRACQSNQRMIKSQLEVYKASTGDYPETADFAGFLGNTNYFESLPECPLSEDGNANDYDYSYDTSSSSYEFDGCVNEPTNHALGQ